MITSAQIREIRAFLQESENPLFFFDDDADGLIAYTLLMRKYRKGQGVRVKNGPEVASLYREKVKEYTPDLVLFLDKPFVPQEVLDEVSVPVVWIDHHEPFGMIRGKNVHYYNPMILGRKDNRPTSYWAYRVVKENEWLAVIGIIADWHVPRADVLKKFAFKHLLDGKKKPQDLYFHSEYGILVKLVNFILKGKSSDVRKNIDVFMEVESPLEILEQSTDRGKYLYDQFQKVNRPYEKLLYEALKTKPEGCVFVFTYPSAKHSFTSMLSNELLHKVKQDVVIIGRDVNGELRMSLRSKKRPVLPLLKKALGHVKGFGGGHEHACGAGIKTEDLDTFVSFFQ